MPTKTKPDQTENEVAQIRANLAELETELAAMPAEVAAANGDEDVLLRLIVRERALPQKIIALRRQLFDIETQSLDVELSEVQDRELELGERLESARKLESRARADRVAIENEINACERRSMFLLRRYEEIERSAQQASPEPVTAGGWGS